MRWLGVLAILAYRVVVRPFMRRQCLYDESCSAFGIRVLRERGFVQGVSLTRARIRSCRIPAAACFVLGADGTPRLLSASTPLPPRAAEWLSLDAQRTLAATAPRDRA